MEINYMSESIPLNKSKAVKMAERYVEIGMIDSAIDEYEKILNIDPNAFSAINTLGDLYSRVGRIEDAVKIFLRIAESYCENGFTLKAIAMYKKINKLEHNNYEISMKIGDLYAKQGLIVDARKWYLEIADYYRKNGQRHRMLEVIKKSADLEPENANLWLQLAENYHAENFNNEAYEAFLQAGRGFLSKGYHSEALKVHQTALKISPGSRPAIKSIIYILIQQNELQRAFLMLTESLEKEPDDTDLLILLGRACINANLLEEAEAALGRLLEMDSSRYGYLLDVGKKFLEDRNFDRVISIVDRCIELSAACRQENKAVSLLNEILKSEPNSLKALISLASIYKHKKEMDSLTSTLKKIVEMAQQQGGKDEAIAALRELIKLDPKEPSYKEKLVLLSGLPLAGQAEEEPFEENTPDCPEHINAPEEMMQEFIKGELSEVELTDQLYSIGLDEGGNKKETVFELPIETEGLDISNLLFDGGSVLEDKPVTDLKVQLHDSLTEIYDRRYFETVLEHEWRRAIRNTTPVSIILFYVGNLLDQKSSCSTCKGSDCLKHLVNALNGELKREGDLLALYSPQEIAVLLPGVSAEGVNLVAKRMRERLESISIAHAGSELDSQPHISAGISTTVPQRRSSPAMMIINARTVLYQEKQKSNNPIKKTNDVLA
jgi:diguanylate cyclase (GGDEF)-like protein